jgi:hypothetical protein
MATTGRLQRWPTMCQRDQSGTYNRVATTKLAAATNGLRTVTSGSTKITCSIETGRVGPSFFHVAIMPCRPACLLASPNRGDCDSIRGICWTALYSQRIDLDVVYIYWEYILYIYGDYILSIGSDVVGLRKISLLCRSVEPGAGLGERACLGPGAINPVHATDLWKKL